MARECIGSARQVIRSQASYYRADMVTNHVKRGHSNVCTCSHDVLVDARHLLAEHVAFGEQFEAPLRINGPPRQLKRPARCLQLALFLVISTTMHSQLSNAIVRGLAQIRCCFACLLHAYATDERPTNALLLCALAHRLPFG